MTFIRTAAELRSAIARPTAPRASDCALGACASWESLAEYRWEAGQMTLVATLSDPAVDEPTLEERPLGPPGDLCRLADADQGRPYNHAWYLSMNPQGGPPMPGGPVGANFNCLLRIEVGNGRVELMGVPPGAAISEPAHVPSSQNGHDGWLLTVVDIPNHPDPSQQIPGDYRSELWIVDAGNVAAGPVAKVKAGIGLRSQVHGAWVSRARMDASAHKA